MRRERGSLLQTTALWIEERRITAIYITRNPDNLDKVWRLVVLDIAGESVAGPSR